MNRVVTVLSGVSALGACAAVVIACNGLLGIGPASLADDGGTPGQPSATCQYYCDTIMQNCPTGTANAEYLTPAICMSMCPAFDSNGNIADSKDNTLDCRIFNAQQAAKNPDVYCRYAGPLGGGHCGADPCQPFCTLDTTYCDGKCMQMNGDNVCKPVIYSSPDVCEAACKQNFPYLVDAGDTALESTNTLNCRLWHLETAFVSNDNGEYHCPHTAVMSATCFNLDAGTD
ncbi:MAG TPA: hypothetical protein VF765_02680 [Polyangiaceae bacterium]